MVDSALNRAAWQVVLVRIGVFAYSDLIHYQQFQQNDRKYVERELEGIDSTTVLHLHIDSNAVLFQITEYGDC